eukprot:TRINITY_DN26787_c0_g1_i1.p1 TRINITY_DN26787_c0_g1~~TRINITY_DN26787_c0_g1_i1.p1  ORF type:complete len:128 (+),score=36.79 TRINITY_DN26787_c0_g1_i1:93-476(+)
MFSFFFFFLMIRRPPRSTLSSSSAASDVYKRQIHLCDVAYERWLQQVWSNDELRAHYMCWNNLQSLEGVYDNLPHQSLDRLRPLTIVNLSLIHISEPTRLLSISYAVFCLKKKKKNKKATIFNLHNK